MGVVVDTSVLIDVERRQISSGQSLGIGDEGRMLLSVVTVSELLYGLRRTAESRMRARRSAFIDGVLATADVLDIDARDAGQHAELRFALERGGTPIGPNDLWIAAQALARGHAVATLNVREFARVPGLRVIG